MPSPVRTGLAAIEGRTAHEICASIQRLVEQGELVAGDSLPTMRSLAETLGVNRNTAAAAYRQLAQSGVVAAASRRGTVILHQRASSPGSQSSVRPTVLMDLASGNPDPALLPPLQRYIARMRPEPALYGAPAHRPQLVDLAERLFADRPVKPERTIIMNGALDALSKILSANLSAGDAVALEDPAYAVYLRLCRMMGYRVVPLAMDDQGILPDSLAASLQQPVKAVVVTPRAQNPTGAAMTPDRAQRLQTILAKHPDLILIEDDHIGMLSPRSIVSLVSEETRRWSIVRSTSKAFGPDMRMSFVCGDDATISGAERLQQLSSRWVSHILQELVLSILQDPALPQMMETARQAYEARRQSLIEHFARRGLNASGASGLNVWLPVENEQQVAMRLIEKGWSVATSEPFRITDNSAIRLSIGKLPVELIARLADDVADSVLGRNLTMPA